VQIFDLPKVGEASKETVIAPFTFDIIRSHEEIERERQKAMEKVFIVTNYDPEVRKQVRHDLQELHSSVMLLNGKGVDDSMRIRVHEQLAKMLSESTISAITKRPSLVDEAIYQATLMLDRGLVSVVLVPSMDRLIELRAQYNTSFDNHLIYNKDYLTLKKENNEIAVRVNDLVVKEIALEQAAKRLKNRKYDDEALTAMYELLFVYLAPNVKVDGAETKKRKLEASKEILEISGKLIKDTEIVRKHQEVTPDIIRKLQSLRMAIDKRENVAEKHKVQAGNVGRFILIVLPLLFLSVYIRNSHPVLLKTSKHIGAFAIILVFQILLIRAVLVLLPRLFENTGEITSFIPEYLIPTAMGSTLISILFGLHLSLLYTLFISIFFAVALGFNHYFFLIALLGGVTAAFYAHKIRYRWHFFKMIPPVIIIYLIVIALWHFIGYKFTFISVFQNFGLALINVLSSVFLAMMLTPVFERFFDITTDMTLVELSDMNHPILKRLSIEAAGTYNHSVLVGNLAESAAAKIGANPLLARVASYYHDIGKIEKADYFVENYLNGDKDRHSRLAPSMSALIISSHVKEGVELARDHRLPKVIQDAILQHHGTSTVSFFFEKALEQDPHKQVQEEDFRYPGPSPQTRENAIIMLADSVEAASRSLATSSPKLLRELVKKIIRDKFLSSQLDQCNLTLRDLDDIVEGFMPVLQGIFHSRIEYPSK